MKDSFQFQGKRLSRVISVCHARDIQVWTLTSHSVIRHIEADSYQLICPDSQVMEFRKASAPRWSIVGENEIVGLDLIDRIRSEVSGENLQRVHWLYQQYLKIDAIRNSDLQDDEAVLIWDADTVPLRRLEFVELLSGRLLCYHGKERHDPYFLTIERLLGSGQVADFSFITQCLPLKVKWARDMVCDIEARFGMSYTDAVLSVLPGVSGSEFSEYETLGTWMLRNNREEFILREANQWVRNGRFLLGKDSSSLWSRFVMILLSLRFDFVGIESWHRPVNLERIRDWMLRIFKD